MPTESLRAGDPGIGDIDNQRVEAFLSTQTTGRPAGTIGGSLCGLAAWLALGALCMCAKPSVATGAADNPNDFGLIAFPPRIE